MAKQKKYTAKPRPAPSDKAGSRSDSKPFASAPLIRFDRKTLVFLGVLMGLYLVAGALRLHTSSVARWDQMFGHQEPASVLWGKPRPIRQDEWMVQTPGIVGQVRSGMPVSSETLGAGNVPLLSGYPVRDISMLLRPNLWPYFILDLETAFAYSWDFNLFALVITTFLLFLVLSGSSFGVSAAMALVVFLSGAMQWWSYALGVGMTWLNIALISVLYLLYSPKRWHLYLAGLGLLVGAFNFFATLYPPWHVPLAYLYGALFAGLLVRHRDFSRMRRDLPHRIVAGGSALLILAFFAWHQSTLLRDTYALMLDTVYPGRRTATGGDLIAGKFFSEFFGPFLQDIHVPPVWLNICEASGVVAVFPIVFYGMAHRWVTERKMDALQVALAVYLAVIGTWLLVGFPDFLSRLTFLSMSPAYRTLPVFGIANLFLLVAWLGTIRKEAFQRKHGIELAALAIGTGLFLWLVIMQVNKATDQFFSMSEMVKMVVLWLVVYLMIRFAGLRYVLPALLVVLLAVHLPNARIHPVARGLDPLLENPLVKLTESIRQSNPDARWCVFGMQRLSNLLKANGMNIFNGVKVVPLLDDMAILDPGGVYASVYNRYAHINMERYMTTQDTVVFRLNENEVVNDNYTIFMDPCSPRLSALGITHYLFTYQPPAEEVRCMTLVGQYSTLFVYQRNPS